MTMALLDQNGRPFPSAALQRPAAPATMVGMRPAAVSTPIAGLNPASLGGLMRAADMGDSLAWHLIAAEIERRDLHYLGVLGTRKRSVSQLPITVTPGDESKRGQKIADFVRDWVNTGLLRHSLFDMLDAIGKGFSVMEIDWALAPGNNRPRDLLFKPQRWFEVSYQDGETIMLRSEDGASQVPGIPGGPPLFGFDDMVAQKFVIHKHPSWSGLTIQSGLTRAVAWAVMFKMFTLRDWSIFVQNYGLPMRIGTYGPESSEEDRDVLWQAVTDIAGSCAAIIPKGMEVNFIEPKGGAGSHELHLSRIRWFDDQISKAVLGQTGTADSHQGAHASSKTHRLVQEDIERADALLLSHTICQQIVQPMVDFSFGPQAQYPIVAIGRPDEPTLQELMQAIQYAGPQGWKVRAQDLYDRYALTPPEEGDVVVGQTAAAQPVEPPQDVPPTVKPAKISPGSVVPPSVKQPSSAQQQPQVMGEGQAEQTALHVQLGQLLEQHVQAEGPELVALMTQRLARDAASGLRAITAAARDAVERASSFDDLERRLRRLNLPDDAFAEAMAQGIAISQLAGQAQMLGQMTSGRMTRRD
ncbi:DUF935 domain-containing protein [Neokomagataea anthophila]|nr:DUF935 family protein [Neokomagataea anthophila]